MPLQPHREKMPPTFGVGNVYGINIFARFPYTPGKCHPRIDQLNMSILSSFKNKPDVYHIMRNLFLSIRTGNET